MNTDGGIHEIPLPATAGGRLWLCGKHAIGPDPEGLMRRVGADGVVCLNEEHELAARYPQYVTWLRAQPRERALWYPIPDLHAPGLEQFAPVLTDIVDRVVAGGRLIVHCAAGIGRAGTTAVAVLVSLAVPLDEAIEHVSRHRPGAGPEAGAQLELVRRLHAHLAAARVLSLDGRRDTTIVAVDDAPQREEFVGRDLVGAEFWSVDLTGATFEDVNLSDVSIARARLRNVTIDGPIENLRVNGVDVTAYVNEHDPWYPLRSMIEPPDPAGMMAAWRALEEQWASTIEHARRLTDSQVHERVGGEWSFVETMRHLVFCTDKWFQLPVIGGASFQPIGLSNTGSLDFDWPGIDRAAGPTLDEALAVRADQGHRFATFLDTVTDHDLTRSVEVLENGTATVGDCVRVVLEEEFEHLRYARRDLP